MNEEAKANLIFRIHLAVVVICIGILGAAIGHGCAHYLISKLP